MKLQIKVPVVCQNGHKAIATIEINGLEYTYKGVPRDQDCDYPKWGINEGWKANGKPYTEQNNDN